METNGKPLAAMVSAATRQKLTEPDSEAFEHITLTSEETAEALRAARETKHYAIKKAEYFASLDAPRPIFKPSAAQWLEAYRERFTTDEVNNGVVIELCAYFAGSEHFNGDLKKGILLAGPIGVGKTAIMKFFKFNAVQSFRVVSSRTIENEYSHEEGGETVLQAYTLNRPGIATDPFASQELALCIDDLGTESAGKHYGKERNVISEIIQNRYDAQRLTHATTNVTANDLENTYGKRVTDRLKEMMNIIVFPQSATSRRK